MRVAASDQSVKLNSNIQLYHTYPADDQIQLVADNDCEVTIRQYDTTRKDQQNITKLFFELLSASFEELSSGQKRDLVINIINSSIILRKYNQALDFISKL